MAPLPPDQDRSLYPVITHCVSTVLALGVVAFRLTARFTSSGLKWDDFFITLAMITTVSNLPFTIIGSSAGIGRHAMYITDIDDLVLAVKTLVVGQFLLLLALCFVKVSVLLFLLSIGRLLSWVAMTLYVTLFLIVSSTLAFSVVLWAQCRPVAANWDPRITGAYCLPVDNYVAAVYVLSVITIITDFLCALLPLPVIWKLQLNRRTKLGVMGVMGLGLVAGASSIVRIDLVKDLKHAKQDPTWALIDLGVWTVIELHIAIIVASLPPSRALALRLWAWIRGRAVGGLSHESNKRNGSAGSRWWKKAAGDVALEEDDEAWLRMRDLSDRASGRSKASERPSQP